MSFRAELPYDLEDWVTEGKNIGFDSQKTIAHLSSEVSNTHNIHDDV